MSALEKEELNQKDRMLLSLTEAVEEQKGCLGSLADEIKKVKCELSESEVGLQADEKLASTSAVASFSLTGTKIKYQSGSNSGSSDWKNL